MFTPMLMNDWMPDPQPEAGGQIRLELQAALRGEPRDVEAAPDQRDEQRQRQHDAGEAQLLGQHREQEVGVRLRQIEQLLHALAEPDAEPLAAADGDQRLRELEAAVDTDRPRDRRKRQDAPQAVAAKSPPAARSRPRRSPPSRSRSASARRPGTACRSRWRTARWRRRSPAPRSSSAPTSKPAAQRLGQARERRRAALPRAAPRSWRR